MSKAARLVLEDGATFEGYTFGASLTSYGEVVFNTTMTGYQEVLTDPSYAGQIVILTYPLVGNYGISEQDVESKRIQVRGFVVREDCHAPSHWNSTGTLSEFLASQNIVGLGGVDTRAITRRLRSSGVMMGIITLDDSAEAALKQLGKSTSLRRQRLRRHRLHSLALRLEYHAPGNRVLVRYRRPGLRTEVQHPAHPEEQGLPGKGRPRIDTRRGYPGPGP